MTSFVISLIIHNIIREETDDLSVVPRWLYQCSIQKRYQILMPNIDEQIIVWVADKGTIKLINLGPEDLSVLVAQPRQRDT